MSLRTPAEASRPLLGLNIIGLPKEDVTETSRMGWQLLFHIIFPAIK
jgi:hypothetical protein